MNPRLAAIASAILFSTGGAAIKSTALTSWQVSGLRSLVAALTVAMLIPASRKSWTWRTALVAFAYALCLTSFVIATKNTTSANAILLQGTAPLYLVLLGPWLLDEKAKRSDWLTLALVAAGMVLVFWKQNAAQTSTLNPALGNLLGAVCGTRLGCHRLRPSLAEQARRSQFHVPGAHRELHGAHVLPAPDVSDDYNRAA